jgi:hypothetical protein
MAEEAFQDTIIEITGTVMRLIPCAYHATLATGEQWDSFGVIVNPNGYRPDCPVCASTPRQFEDLDFDSVDLP